MMDALSVFQKYIGTNNHYSSLPSVNITDINQVIGALQSIDLCLKKSLNELDSPNSLDELVSKCSFMGENLFDKQIPIASIKKTFHIHNPLLENHSKEEIDSFIQDKRKEIAHLLDLIFAFLDDEESKACNDSAEYAPFVQRAF